MFKIIKKRILNEQVKLFTVDAPYIARKAEPGQFIILRIDETGERIPLTISDFDREKGEVTIVFQEVGKNDQTTGRAKRRRYDTGFLWGLWANPRISTKT